MSRPDIIAANRLRGSDMAWRKVSVRSALEAYLRDVVLDASRRSRVRKVATLLARGPSRLLSAPDEIDHESHCRARVRLEEEMAGVKDVSFHTR
jgi:hypothetical protein